MSNINPLEVMLGLRFLKEMRLDNDCPQDAEVNLDIAIKVGVAALAMRPSWTDEEVNAVANTNAEECAEYITPELNAALEDMFEQILYPVICEQTLKPLRDRLKDNK